MIVNPGAWSHYSYAIHDALDILDVPIVEVHLSNIHEREEWRRHSVIADLAAHRVIGKGPDGYREALVLPGGSGRERALTAARLERLRQTLEQRLLVTNLVNIRYLTGLRDARTRRCSSIPKGPAKLFTDFRYIEAAEAIPGVEAVLAKRSLMVDLGEAAAAEDRVRGGRPAVLAGRRCSARAGSTSCR